LNHSGQSAEAETFSLHGFSGLPSSRTHLFLVQEATIVSHSSLRECEAGIGPGEPTRRFDYCGSGSGETPEAGNSTKGGTFLCAPFFFVPVAERRHRNSRSGAGA
jgi:hypothetical protein